MAPQRPDAGRMNPEGLGLVAVKRRVPHHIDHGERSNMPRPPSPPYVTAQGGKKRAARLLMTSPDFALACANNVSRAQQSCEDGRCCT